LAHAWGDRLAKDIMFQTAPCPRSGPRHGRTALSKEEEEEEEEEEERATHG
jgi:hypothetical protein